MFCIFAPAFAPGKMKKYEKSICFQEQRLSTYHPLIQFGHLVVLKKIIL